MKEITYWVIRFTGLDGHEHELPNHFSARENAETWADGMPAWQAPEVVQMWEYR